MDNWIIRKIIPRYGKNLAENGFGKERGRSSMFRYLKDRMISFVGVITLIIISTAVLSGGNIVNQRLIDAVTDQNLYDVKLYILLTFGYSLFSMALFVASSICRDIFKTVLIHDIRLSVFDGIIRRSPRDFFKVCSADYVSALTNDINTLHGQYLSMFFLNIIGVLVMLFSALLMLYFQPFIAVCAIFSALIMTIAPSALGSVMGRWETLRSRRLTAFTAMLSECFRGYETITSFGVQGQLRRQFRECSEALRDCEYHTQGLNALSDNLAQLLSNLAQCVVLALSCWMVLTGRMSMGGLVVFANLNGSFCSGLSACLKIIPLLKSVKPVITRVNGYADYICPDKQGDKEPHFLHSLTVENVRFGYDKKSFVLNNLSLTLHRGGKYALIGESGCGKSTLIHLLLGDYPNYDGGIYYDGTELRNLQRSKIHQVAVCIHQDVFLFDDTIHNNICLFEEFSEEQLAWALKASGVLKFTETLPEGTSYMVGENGERLSGGQRQRIAIARALIRNTDFLILDEGTSALDEETAWEIESELLEMRELTLLTITHHLNSPQKYDQVFTLSAK